MNKYQFYISFNNKPGTASLKAINDCTAILSSLGYRNFNVNVKVDSRFYLLSILIAIVKLLFSIRRNSLLAIQYPLLSGNKTFKYVIRILHARNIKILAIIHDLDELRYKQSTEINLHADSTLLNDYDCIIAHNEIMITWLRSKGVKTAMLPLGIFDYLSDQPDQWKSLKHPFPKKIVFAGNLSKSTFIYDLHVIDSWNFNFYGPNIVLSRLLNKPNLCWGGSLSAEEVLSNMDGSFGLIWDGSNLNFLDEEYGDYLRFNNPHKLSLYLAAGLPVIVPANSAVASFVESNQCGLLLPGLTQLNDLQVSADQFDLFRKNAYRIGQELKKGTYLRQAIVKAEDQFLRFY
jgi:hypothetical protein